MIDAASSTSFALRIPPAYKEAAKAISEVGTLWKRQEDGTPISIGSGWGSINQAFIFLLKHGLESTKDIVETTAVAEGEEHEVFSEIMTFFLANPSAREAFPSNFPEGSAARTWIENVTRDFHEDDNYDPDRPVADRPWISEQYAGSQRRIFAVNEALGAIQRALATSR